LLAASHFRLAIGGSNTREIGKLEFAGFERTPVAGIKGSIARMP